MIKSQVAPLVLGLPSFQALQLIRASRAEQFQQHNALLQFFTERPGKENKRSCGTPESALRGVLSAIELIIG